MTSVGRPTGGGIAVVAVDFGATSIRVVRIELGRDEGAGGPDRPPVAVVHRYHHQPVHHADGSLRWDWDRLVAELHRGLEAALDRGPVASIGIDTWGVDYGLIDADGALLSPPHAYRSTRTAGYRDVVDRIGAEALYARTGTQVQPFNTIFQLAAHDRDELAAASHLLLLPDLLAHALTGSRTAERTAAGTTGLLDLVTSDWSPELLDAIGVRRSLLPAVVEPGTAVGTWRGVPIHLVGGHDTASAVAAQGVAGGPTSAFVATGTWLLVGREQAAPDVGVEARAANFTNEQGVVAPGTEGSIRFLKNVAGFWMLEGCRQRWGGFESPEAAAQLLDEAAALDDGAVPRFDATDEQLLAPDDMVAVVCGLAGLPVDAPPPLVARSIVASMAATAASVASGLGGVVRINLVGGGAGVGLLQRSLATASGLPVHVGPTEAAAIGNALVQAVALGVVDDLAAARRQLLEPLVR